MSEQTCIRCGRPLSETPPASGLFVGTIKADEGTYHVACYGRQGAYGGESTAVQALKEIRALAANELAHPTGLHATCLSIILKTAQRALEDTP